VALGLLGSGTNQKAPDGDWNTWLVLPAVVSVRPGWVRNGFVKTSAEVPPSRLPFGMASDRLVAETAADARDVMVLGDSGILACHPKEFRPEWSPTNRRLTWPNGLKAWCYNATEPDQLRGPQHHFAWVDELAKFRYMQETWDQLQFGLRLGLHPQALVTTTPRPTTLDQEA
jgi:phage terminase large subunit-like protein